MPTKISVKRWTMLTASASVLALSAGCASFNGADTAAPPPPQTWQKTVNGVIITPKNAAAKKVRLMVMSDKIIRVTASASGTFDTRQSLIVRAAPENVHFNVSEKGDTVELKTDKVTADVSVTSGKVTFHKADGSVVLAGVNGGDFSPVSIGGKPFYNIRQEFNRGTDEGFYGLGQHQNHQMNYNGEDVTFAQYNTDVAVPMVVSTRNYGVLWDNYAITHWGYPKDYAPLDHEMTLLGADGKSGGLTASYYHAGKMVAQRIESDPNYQYIPDQKNFPDEARAKATKTTDLNQGEAASTWPDLKVVYDGAMVPKKTGLHKFQFYVSGYFKLWVNGKLVMDCWRQGWHPTYRNFEMQMTAGQPVKIRAEWKNEGSAYLRFLHRDPVPEAVAHEMSWQSDVASAIDYYYIDGQNMDQVISGYHHLTGKAKLLPMWAYGFWQSRQRYETQDQLVDVVKKYRELNVPLDNIVQDWRYWTDPSWGSHEFDASRFPHPVKMVDDVHDLHAHFMIVIWPKFYPGLKNYEEFEKHGLMYPYAIKEGYKDWVGKGYLSTNYDAYSPLAKDIYWKQVDEKLDSYIHPDSWWMDNDEPDIHSNMPTDDQVKMRDGSVYGPGALIYNTYPLEHVCGFYDHWQAANPNRRTFILTRSGFAGLQRCSAGVWSGDIVGRWSDMKDQISAGVNFSMSGIPNWSMDIGGYAVEERYIKPTNADWKKYQELYTRWYQFGAFVPIFRSHGESVKREIYNIAKPGTAIFNIIKTYDELRYRLMPYIYTSASATYLKGSTLMRGLVMDYGADKKVWGINDEYMFGKDILVAPVTESQVKSRPVYLPAGTDWYDLFTGEKYTGGQAVDVKTPLSKMPLFVHAGAIVPTGPVQQYVGQKPKAPVTFVVYTGSDGTASLYEDDGTSNAYENGKFSSVPLSYNDATGTLTIGARKGDFDGMLKDRTFKVRFISGKTSSAADFPAHAKTVHYDGHALSITK